MSHHCQFCDKKMILQESIVHIKEYVTCGKLPCVKKAKANDLFHRKEKEKKYVNIVVFTSKTPEDYNSWIPLEHHEHPSFIKDTDIMLKLLQGDIANLKDSDDCYRVKLSQDLNHSEFPYIVQLLMDDIGIIEKDQLNDEQDQQRNQIVGETNYTEDSKIIDINSKRNKGK